MGLFDSRDDRTKRQKLEAMASQTESPNEAAIAREKLKTHHIFRRREHGDNDEDREWSRYHRLPRCAASKGGNRCIEVEGHGSPHWTGKPGDQWRTDLGMRKGSDGRGGRTTYHGPPPPGFHDAGPADDD